MLFAPAMSLRIRLTSTLLALFAVACSSKQEAPPPETAPGAKAVAPEAPKLAPQPAPPDVAAPPADAKKLDSGVWKKVLTKGTGDVHPGDHDDTTVQYSLWTTDGRMYDSTVSRGQPAAFPLDRIPPGWAAALVSMTIGEKARFWIPEELAFKGRKGPQGMLCMEFELLNYKKGVQPPPDVAAAPPDAVKTASGVAVKVVTAGAGKVNPKVSDIVQVKYSSWTADGKMFDSSDGQLRSFVIKALIQGLRDGLISMVEGEKARMWIPEALAYQGKAGAPAGTLCFEIELVKIEPPPTAPK